MRRSALSYSRCGRAEPCLLELSGETPLKLPRDIRRFWAGNFPRGRPALEEFGPLTPTAGRAVIAAPVLVLVLRLTAPRSSSATG